MTLEEKLSLTLAAYDADQLSESVCIIDFCGRSKPDNFPTSFSSDYFPAEKLLYFTGDWGVDYIPPMPSATEPTEAEAYAWARQHGGAW